MGRLTLILAVLFFGAAIATVRLPFPAWAGALYLTLVLACLVSFSALGWASRGFFVRRGLAAFPLVSSLAGLCAVGLSYLLVGGPGRLPPVETVTVDFPAWLVSALGLAGAIACIGYGGYAVRAGGGWARAAGLGLVGLGILTPQAAARELGLPGIGPIGAAALIVVLLAGVLLVGRISSRGSRAS